MSFTSFSPITIVSVNGLADARGSAMALQVSLEQMPGAQALLCSPQRPDNLPSWIAHHPIAPLNYHEYSWFMMMVLWRFVQTDFALIVQDDGWVINASNWQDEFFNYDYLGAPVHLARIDSTEGTRWARSFSWLQELNLSDRRVTPIQNGGFCLRSQRMMRVLAEHPEIPIEIPRPELLGPPYRMYWSNDALNEDVQLSGLLRPRLEQLGLRFAPTSTACRFAVEDFVPPLQTDEDLSLVFGQHSRFRPLTCLAPKTICSLLPEAEIAQWRGVPQILAMLERNGYRIEFKKTHY